MDDTIKTKKQLIDELKKLRRKVSHLEKLKVKDRKEEEAFSESEEKYRTTFESTGTATVIIEEDTTLSTVNSEFERLCGYSREEIEGKKSWTEFVVKEDLERMKEYHRQRRTEEGAAPTNYEFRFIDRHGNIKEIFLTIAVIPGTKKSVASLLDVTERKRAEKALRKSEESYRSLQANIPVGIFRTTADPEGHLLSVNPALAKMFGYDKPEAMSETRVADLYLNHDDRKKFVEAVSSAEAISNYEVQFKRKDGTPFWGSLNARAITDETGRVAHFDGVLEDITERKRSEETLNKRVKELNCLYGISNLVEKPDITLEEIIQGTVNLIPPSWQYPDITCARIIIEGKGYTTENFRETEWVQTADVTTHGRRAGTVEVYYLEERPQSDEGPFLKEERHLLYAIAKRLGKIAERKRAEEALRKEKEKAQSYLDIAGVMFVVIGSDKKVSLINKRGGEILGYKEEDIVGKNWFDNFLPERIRENIKARFDVLMAREKEPDPYFENPILTKDGEERIILWHNTILTDDSGNIIGTLSSGEDITERKRAEQTQSVLYEIANAVNKTEDIKELFKSIHGTLGAIIDTTNFYIALYDKETDTLSFPYFVDERNSFTSVPAKSTITSYVVRKGKPLLATEDIMRKLAKSGEVDEKGIATPAKAWLGVPLKSGDEVIGVVAVQSYTDSALYSERDLEVLKFVSDQIAIAIEYKKAEDARDQHRLELQSLFEGIDVLIWSVREGPDGELYYEQVNTAFASADGHTPEYFYGKRISELHPPSELKGIHKSVEMAKRGKPHIYETQIEINNELKDMAVRFSPLIEPDGQIRRFIGFGMDITERKRTEEERDIRRRELEALYSLNRFLISTLDLKEILTQSLKLALKSTELDAAALYLLEKDDSLRLVASEGFSDEFMSSVERLEKGEGYTGKAVEQNVMQVVSIDDYPPSRLKDMLIDESMSILVCVPLTSKEKPLGVINLISKEAKNLEHWKQDLIQSFGHQISMALENALYFSDLNEYSKALESLLKERSEFFSMASHELRTPIAVVNGYLDIIERNLENMDSTQIHETLKKVMEHSERLTLLVETLLDISKIEDPKSILSSEVCEIEPIVKRALNLCEHQAQEKQITCHFEGFDCEDGKPCVIGDALAIENVLLNILGNAIKYSNEGSEVTIRCDTEDDTLRLDCIDQGIGLPPGVEERIFEEFYRVEQGGELKKSGTGLGLSIAKRLVERMGGRIWAHSEGLNKGTTVSFTLPLVKSENLAEKE